MVGSGPLGACPPPGTLITIWMTDMCWIPYVDSRSESSSRLLSVKINLMCSPSVQPQKELESIENFNPIMVFITKQTQQKDKDVHTCRSWNLLQYLHLQLLYRHALHLLFGVAQVNCFLLSQVSVHHNLIDFAHFLTV